MLSTSPAPLAFDVLLIEDDLVDAEFIRQILEDVGPSEFQLHHVGSLGEAASTLAKHDIAVILLDLNLPESRGLETFTRCQALAAGVPIVVLSGIVSPTFAERAAVGACMLSKEQIDGERLRRVLRRALWRHEMEQNLFHAATHDPLTGLANRLLFTDRLVGAIGRSRRSGCGGALFFIDLDGFKPINDSHGHAAGDQVLAVTAERLRATVRETDCVARLGGDEFAVILEGIGERTLLARKAAEMLVRVAQPIVFEEGAVQVYGSLGVARFPYDADDPQTLFDRADEAMYAAKARGGGVVRFTSPIADGRGEGVPSEPFMVDRQAAEAPTQPLPLARGPLPDCYAPGRMPASAPRAGEPAP